MEDPLHARHLLGRRHIDSDDAAVGDGRLDGNGIQRSRKVEVGRVLRRSGHLLGTIDARGVAADR
jgi:hypothetical protein